MDICRVSINNTSDKWENLTKENLAADSAPMFSPDGNYLAYRAQKRPGFEADKWEIMIVETNKEGTFKGKPVSFTGALKTDISVNDFTWAGKDKILFTADHLGKVALFQILPLEDVPTVGSSNLIKNQMSGYNSGISASADGAKIAFLNASMASPPEVFAGNADLRLSKPINISKVNEGLLKELELPKPESVTLPGAGDVPTQMWILKPRVLIHRRNGLSLFWFMVGRKVLGKMVGVIAGTHKPGRHGVMLSHCQTHGAVPVLAKSMSMRFLVTGVVNVTKTL